VLPLDPAGAVLKTMLDVPVPVDAPPSIVTPAPF
jgi:hypothetical protein